MRGKIFKRTLWLATTAFICGGCAGSTEQLTLARLVSAEHGLAVPRALAETTADEPVPVDELSQRRVDFEGRLGGYVAHALRHSPDLRASFERWRAATLRISRPRRLPEPMLSFGHFVRRVETRVGPQRHRFGLSQVFPWPTKLTAGSEAAAQAAVAAQRRFDARLLAVTRQVADAYWRLWHIDEAHRIKTDHDKVLEALAGTVRGRVETGRASLAELNQIDLGVARHHDHHGEHREQRRAAVAALAAAVGLEASDGAELVATDMPQQGLPATVLADLRSSARSHPRIAAMSAMAAASDARAVAEGADRWPSFRIGVDYIETGPARMANVADSGQDPIVVGLGVRLPLWVSSYTDAVDAAAADAAGHRAGAQAARLQADAALEASLSAIRDAQRRLLLYRDTLLPQAETTLEAVLGSYKTGRSTIAASLLAERDLLELQLALAKVRAEHARGWARLEEVVGQVVPRETQEKG